MVKITPTPPSEDSHSEAPLGKRLLWFFGIAIVSCLCVASVAYLLRGLLFL